MNVKVMSIKMIASNVLESMASRGQTLAVAESCTGGLLGVAMTENPGSSAVFMGGIIAYDNAVKTDVLRVGSHTIVKHGAVSAECALEMANSVKALLNTTTGIAITGIAGPDGATEDKPVGTVFIATVIENKELVKRYCLKGNRAEVREKSVESALVQLLDMMACNIGSKSLRSAAEAAHEEVHYEKIPCKPHRHS